MRELVRFWKDPAHAFLKTQGFSLPREVEDEADWDRAPLAMESLTGWRLRNAVVREVAFGQGDLDLTEARLRADRGLPPGQLGSEVWRSNRERSETLAHSVRALLGDLRMVEVELAPPGVRVSGRLQMDTAGRALLAYREGKADALNHYLDAWIQALLASASGSGLPTLFLSEENPGLARELAVIDPVQANECLSHLVEGLFEGRSRPLCFALKTSGVIAKPPRNGWPDTAAALAAASKEWHRAARDGRSGGEGTSAAALIAWRDRDPFDEAEEWMKWARRICEPLRQWSGL